MKILGIETSCDETSASVIEVTKDRKPKTENQKSSVLGLRFSVLTNVVASQIKLHAKTGGVVPEVAARSHVEAMIPVVRDALRKTQSPSPNPSHQGRGIDVIAVTIGPGLITSLRVGVDTARTLAYLWDKPLIGINHLEGHIYANWLKIPDTRHQIPEIEFPLLCLIVSGGHTELVLMKKHLDYKIIGATRDDAAGEAFDKVAKILGLGYPGGPAVSRLAEKGNPKAIDFPRPMINSSDFDFSFSGLKTAVFYYVREQKLSKNRRSSVKWSTLKADVCASFEQAAVDVLVAKTVRAAKEHKAKTVLLGGGVAANKRLRKQFAAAVKNQLLTTHYSLPTIKYTTDNAAMIAAAGVFHFLKKDFIPWQKIDVNPNLSL